MVQRNRGYKLLFGCSSKVDVLLLLVLSPVFSYMIIYFTSKTLQLIANLIYQYIRLSNCSRAGVLFAFSFFLEKG